jgi:membrane protein DedA with SNARE-associated domain
MMIAEFVQQYGYYAVAAGTALEGETVLLAAGFAAHRGWLDLPWVIAIALVASSAGDQFCFLLGRRHGTRLMRRFPSLQEKFPVVERLMERHPYLIIIGIRFMYGLRVAGPFVMGASRVPTARFIALNLLGATLWAAIIATIGWYFGAALESVSDRIKHFEESVLLGILAAGAAWWGIRKLARRKYKIQS